MKKIHLTLITLLTISILWSCTSKHEKMESKMKEFISTYEAKIIPLYRNLNLTSWNANVTGTDTDWALSEKASFEYAKATLILLPLRN